MKSRIFLLFILLGLNFQNMAQSDYLTVNEGFVVRDLVSEYTFSTFELNNEILYGFDIDGIHAFDAESGDLLYTEAKPADYSAQPSFMKTDNNSEFIWMGFTMADYSDDRIYRFDLDQKTWEFMATLPANFDVEFIGEHTIISGLNAYAWGEPNNIWLLDLSGDDNHTKLVETGGSSAGITTDDSGNLYYASYFMSEDNHIYKWDAAAILDVINGTSPELSMSDATILSDLTAGAYDCDMDEENNLVFSCNDFTNGSFVGIWNGTTGNGNNYTATCTTTEWLTYVKATGNIDNGDPFYTMAYAKPVAEIKKDVENSISNHFDNSNLKCSPNPFRDVLYVETTGNQTYNVMLFNLNGQLVLETQINVSSYLDLNDLPKGSYLLKMISNENSYTQKLIKN